MNSNTQPLGYAKILELFNLKEEIVKSIDFKSVKSELCVEITLVNVLHHCPCCGNETKKIKGYCNKKILHAALTHMPCVIHYRARRLICEVCRKTFNEHNPFAYRNMKISALTVYNVLLDLKDPAETFSSVAKAYGISPSTSSALFDAHINMPRRKLPRYLLLDEVHAFRSDRGDYVCLLVDALTGTTIDVLPSRRKDYLIKYFNQIPLEEREEVEIVGMDMWNTYRMITKSHFPNAICSLDRFHVIQHLTSKLTAVRIKAMNNCRPPKEWRKRTLEGTEEYRINYRKDQNYYILKKFNWLLTMNSNRLTTIDENGDLSDKKEGKRMRILDPNVPKKYNHKLNDTLNYYDMLNRILELDDDLNRAYSLKLRFESFYRTSTKETAKANLEQQIRNFKNSDIEEMVEFGNTLVNWKNEIIGSFHVVKKNTIMKDPKTGEVKEQVIDSYITNALIENRNRLVKKVKNHASGYGNWERFRNRLMYVMNDDATFRMIPENTSERVKA